MGGSEQVICGSGLSGSSNQRLCLFYTAHKVTIRRLDMVGKKGSALPTDDELKEVAEALNSAKVPTEDRWGYLIKEDGSVEKFGPITRDEFVPVNKGKSKIKIHKVK